MTLRDLLTAASTWLALHVHPLAPWVVLGAAIWLGQYLIRKYRPTWWERFALVGPETENLSKLWQALPSLVLGTAWAAWSSGWDVKLAVFGALAGALAPLWHHILKATPNWLVPYRGGSFPAASTAPKGPAPTPPVVGVLLIALSYAVPSWSVTACADKPASSAATERTAALAFTGAVVALEVLDAREAAYLDSIAQPTPEQLKAAEGRVERLKRARDALALVRDWLTGRTERNATAELGDAARALRLVVEELRADGVRIPASVLDGLQLAELFAGVAS